MILQNGKTIHIQTKTSSYVIIRNDREDLLNFHFGQKITDWDYSADPQLFIEPHGTLANDRNDPFLSRIPQEYPGYGRTDQRKSAFRLNNALGNSVTELKYQSYRILEEQAVRIPGMPSLRGPADTLEITLADTAIGLEVILQYVVFTDLDVIARNAVICNRADKPITLRKACSCCVDFPLGEYDLIHFTGDWVEERSMVRTHLSLGAATEIADNTLHISNSFNRKSG